MLFFFHSCIFGGGVVVFFSLFLGAVVLSPFLLVLSDLYVSVVGGGGLSPF